MASSKSWVMNTIVLCNVDCSRRNSSLHLPPDQRVQGGEGLVEEPDIRLDSKRPADADPLLLAAREFAGEVVAPTLEPNKLDDLEGPGVPGLPVDALHLERKRHVLRHRAVGEEGKVLEHHAHLVATELDHLRLGGDEEVLAVELDLARRGIDEPRHATHQGGLARATEAHEHDDLALVDLERGITDGGDVAVLLDGRKVRVTAMGGEELLGLRPVQLPDVLANDLRVAHVVRTFSESGGLGTGGSTRSGRPVNERRADRGRGWDPPQPTRQ